MIESNDRRRVPVAWAIAALLVATPVPFLVGSTPHMPAAPPRTGIPEPSASPTSTATAPLLREATYPHPPHRPVRILAAGAKSVDPTTGYSEEPAPMGITDFGVNGSGQPYSYSTTEFVATAQITALKGDSSASGTIDGFQLNDVVILQRGHTNYTYWIQNAPDIDTATETLYLDDEVWNMTTASAYMSPGAVVGLGETSEGLYDYSPPGPSTLYPGNAEALTLPLTLELRTTSYVTDGVPSVGIGYNLGSGWVDQDNLTFPFAEGMLDDNFVVDGYAYNGAGLFTDSEFDLVSAGDGVSQVDTGSVLQMALEYSNGHNLQVVPNAWDFGSDTAESMSNALVRPIVAPTSGLPGALWTKGSGKLGPLYNLSREAQVTVVGPPAGTVEVDGNDTPYVGGEAVLTLAPGTYTVALPEGNGTVPQKLVTLTPGEVTTVNFNLETVTVQETGLPVGTAWSVAWSGSLLRSTSSSLTLQSFNATYALNITPIAGFTTSPYDRSVVVEGATVVDVDWDPFDSEVTFNETGLPVGATWSVTLGSASDRGSGPSLSLALPNGTYPYTLYAPWAFEADAPNGNLTVAGFAQVVFLTFSLRPSYIAGTVTPINATVTIDGVTAPLLGGSFNVSLLPGTQTVEAGLSGFETWSETVHTTAGNTSLVSIVLTAVSSGHPGGGSGGTPAASSWTSPEDLAVAGAGGAAVVALLGTALWMRRSRAGPRNGAR